MGAHQRLDEWLRHHRLVRRLLSRHLVAAGTPSGCGCVGMGLTRVRAVTGVIVIPMCGHLRVWVISNTAVVSLVGHMVPAALGPLARVTGRPGRRPAFTVTT